MAEFVTRTDGPGHALAVSGDVDIATIDELLTAARACLEQDTDVCEIDLGGVTFMDSSGLGALVRIRTMAQEGGKQVVLTHVPAAITRLFQVTGLSDVFDARSDG